MLFTREDFDFQHGGTEQFEEMLLRQQSKGFDLIVWRLEGSRIICYFDKVLGGRGEIGSNFMDIEQSLQVAPWSFFRLCTGACLHVLV